MILNCVISTYFEFYSLGCCQKLPLPIRIIISSLSKKLLLEETYKFGEETGKNGGGDLQTKYICKQEKSSVKVERFRKRTWMSCGKKSDKRKENPEKPFGTITAPRTRNISTKNKKKQMHFVNILLFQARFFHYLQPIFAVSKPQLNKTIDHPILIETQGTLHTPSRAPGLI